MEEGFVLPFMEKHWKARLLLTQTRSRQSRASRSTLNLAVRIVKECCSLCLKAAYDVVKLPRVVVHSPECAKVQYQSSAEV